MKYLVMENHEGYSVVMDETGLFHRVANLGYEIGDTVTEPIFMKTPERKKNTNWKKISTIAAIFVCMLLASVPFISDNTESDVVVYMSINPEIHLELNEDGKINKLVADNDDGKVLLEGYKYRGKNAASVLIELIDRAENLKYLTAGGNIRITVESNTQSKAKTVEVDLSEALKENYVKKYLIKIKANEESFRDLDDVLDAANGRTAPSETESIQVTTESEATKTYYYTESYLETTQATESSTVSTTVPTTESQKATSKPTENSKPTVKPTEKPTEIIKPTEPPTEITTEPSSESEPSTEEDDDIEGDDDEDDDYEWPWWPWPFE